MSIPTVRALIAQEQAKCEAATPGPWVRWNGNSGVYAGPVKENTPHCIRGARAEIVTSEAFEGAEDILEEIESADDPDAARLELDVADRATLQAGDNLNLIASMRIGYPAALKALEAIVALIEIHDGGLDTSLKETECGCGYCRIFRPILTAFLAAFKTETQGEKV